jgi:hypothetical protein
VIKEALQLDDKAAAKTFLQRYGEVAREVKNTKDEAESYEKTRRHRIQRGQQQRGV